MATELRDYQVKLVDQVRSAMRKHKGVCMQLETGGGKTAIAGHMIQNLRRKKKRALVLVHRNYLIDQFRNELSKLDLLEGVGLIRSGKPTLARYPIQLASVQTLSRRKDDLQPDLIMIDEAHHATAPSYLGILGTYPKARTVGLTATPRRLDGKGLGSIFGSLVTGPTMLELITLGYLSPFRYIEPDTAPVDMSGVGMKGGDYDRAETERRWDDKAIADVVLAWERHAKRLPTIYYGPTVKKSEEVCMRFRGKGYRAAHIDGKTPDDEVAKVLRRFAAGHIDVLCNCDKITEGFDCPAARCVILGFKTLSLVRYRQQVGRALRPKPDGSDAVILDVSGCYTVHGRPEEEVEWDLNDVYQSEGKDKPDNPYTRCDKCLAPYRATLGECPFCGEARAVMERKLPKEVPMTMRETQVGGHKEIMKAAMSGDRDKLLAMAEKYKFSEGWVDQILRSNNG